MGSPTDLPDAGSTTSPAAASPAEPPQGTPSSPAGSTSETPASGSSLDTIVNGLQDRLDELVNQLEGAQTTAKEVSTQKGQVQTELNQAKKFATSYDAAVAEATTALEGVQTAHDYAQPLIDTLDEDDVEELSNAIKAINDEYRSSEEAFTSAMEELTSLQNAGKAAEAEVAAKQQAFDASSDALSSLSAEIKGLAAPLKSLARDLTAAVDAGQPLKAYVLRSELEATMSKLQRLTTDEHLDSLISTYTTAKEDLANARKAKLDNATALAAQKDAVTSAKSDLDTAKTTRKEQLAQRYVLSGTTSPAIKPA